jgi:hypothetical protein
MRELEQLKAALAGLEARARAEKVLKGGNTVDSLQQMARNLKRQTEIIKKFPQLTQGASRVVQQEAAAAARLARPGGGSRLFSIGPIAGLLIWGEAMYAMLDDLNDRFEELEQYKKQRAAAEELRQRLEPYLKPCCDGGPMMYIGPVAGSALYGKGATDANNRPYWISDCEYQWRLKYKNLPPLEGESHPRAWWLEDRNTPDGPRVTTFTRPWGIDWSDRSAPRIIYFDRSQ